MDLNFFIFPKPAPTYTHDDSYGSIFYVPHDYQQWGLTQPFVSSKTVGKIGNHQNELKAHGSYHGKCIPCLYLPCVEPSTKILLYFHGNAEDIYLTKELAELIRDSLQVHVIVMEYEGYGIYEGKTSAESIIRDAEIVFLYITNLIKYLPADIILFGRSIGSGPATYLASKFRVHSLILMSAFTSLRAVAKGFVGPLLQYIVADRFPNKQFLKNVRCPVFLMHGMKDEIVSYSQAIELHDVMEEAKIDSVFNTPENMDHNSFDFDGDFIQPLVEFYEQREFKTIPDDTNSGLVILPIKAFNKPTK